MEMSKPQLELIDTLCLWLEQEHRIILATIIEIKGQAPRPLGSQFAMREDGIFIGALSGGCAEDKLLKEIQQNFPETPQVRSFSSQTNNGLACQGEMQIALEPVTDSSQFQTILSQLQAGQKVSRRYHIESGENLLTSPSTSAYFSYEFPWLEINYGWQNRLLLVGAVEISKYLIPLAEMLHYQIDICDPRPDYQNAWPENSLKLSTCFPDDWLREKQLDPSSAVITLSHDPRYDDMALMVALPSDAFYVGALGSAKSSQKRKCRLQQLDLNHEDIKRLQAPVGININSRSSAEIAISIMADLIKTKNQQSA